MTGGLGYIVFIVFFVSAFVFKTASTYCLALMTHSQPQPSCLGWKSTSLDLKGHSNMSLILLDSLAFFATGLG